MDEKILRRDGSPIMSVIFFQMSILAKLTKYNIKMSHYLRKTKSF